MFATNYPFLALIGLSCAAVLYSILSSQVMTRQANRKRRFYESVSASNRAVITCKDKQELFSRVCNSAKEKTGYLRVSIIDRFGNVVFDTDGNQSILDISIGLNLLSVFDAAKPNEPVILKKSALDMLLRPKSVCVGLYPIFVNQHAALMLCLIARSNEYLDGEHIELLNEMVSDIEFGIKYIDERSESNVGTRSIPKSSSDQLTGLPNKQDFMSSADNLLHTHNTKQEDIIFCYITVNELNSASDNIWVHNSDEIIKTIAEKICAHTPFSAISHRVGYSDFIVVNRIMKDAPIKEMAEKFLETITTTCHIGNIEVEITPTIGISFYSTNGKTVTELAMAAQRAAFSIGNKAKRIIYSDMVSDETSQNEKTRLEAELKRSLMKGEMELYYQPKVDLQSKEIFCHEALIRWRHPILGTIMPQKFIELAEHNGFIVEMGRWVISEACQQIAKYKQAKSPSCKVAVNISPIQFHDEHLPDFILQEMTKHKIGPGELEFEITESVMIDNKNYALKLLREFKEMGICLSIDDFGTGHSSLAYIKDLPIDQVKIDRAFISGLPGDENSASIVKAIIDIASCLNIAVVAEGVETLEQEQFVKHHGCNYGQGMLYGMPASCKE